MELQSEYRAHVHQPVVAVASSKCRRVAQLEGYDDFTWACRHHFLSNRKKWALVAAVGHCFMVGGGMTASQSPSYSFSVDSWLKQSGASCFTPPGKRVAACENGTHSR